jgi:hypothetical protein
MILAKTRCAVIALVASASFAAASVAPAVSQAQWHTICYSGHCTTHTNYTIQGKDPCVAINGSYDTDYGAYLDALQNQRQQAVMVDPTMTPGQTQADVNDRQAQVLADQQAAFEWGCSLT